MRACDIGFLDDLFVDPDERGQRLGEALIEELVKIAKSKGWPKIRWITSDDNYRARTLYDRVAQKTMWNTYEIVVESGIDLFSGTDLSKRNCSSRTVD